MERIPLSPLDEKFREASKKLIESASQSFYFIEGDLRSLLLPDIQHAVYTMTAKNIKGSVYATEEISPNLQNYAVSIGLETYIGKTLLINNFIVVDGKHFIKFTKNSNYDYCAGTREGEVYYNDPDKTKELDELFNQLKSLSERITYIDKTKDPYWQFLYQKY